MLPQNKSVKPRWRKERAWILLNRKKRKINKIKPKRIKPCRNIQTEIFNKTRIQQILCHD